MIRLLLSDVDGTLVTSDKELTPRSIEAVHELHDAGILFAVTSGRPPRGMSMLVEPLTLSTPLAAFNGGLVVEPDLDVVEERVVPEEARRADDRASRVLRALDLGLPGRRLVRPRPRRPARGDRVAHRAVLADRRGQLRRHDEGRRQDRRRERRPRGGRNGRADHPRRVRRSRRGLTLAGLLPRRHAPAGEQGRRRQATCRRRTASRARRSRRSATCRTTSSCSRSPVSRSRWARAIARCIGRRVTSPRRTTRTASRTPSSDSSSKKGASPWQRTLPCNSEWWASAGWAPASSGGS